ncbi:MAG: bifunctional glutamate N-acetyltransferase/amino-acid acetyltransferase ArgJ [Deinococcus sp.]|nr:bifunctional glutamate N-acetyltransferase/amino-acid acetyltransferase ArgJ [Deinococcus sp.]
MSVPQGFQVAGIRAGLKRSGNPDLALLVSERPATAAGVLTTNRVQAHCVVRNRAILARGRAQAIIINSGNANCATGPVGGQANEDMALAAASALTIAPELVLTASTGVIGRPLPTDQVRQAVPTLLAALQIKDMEPAARAIMTTDTRPKLASATCGRAALAGIAKGSGMIAPNMATMLCFMLTNAQLSPERLRAATKEAAAASFNQITVDGDTSTNDMLIVLANGSAGPVDEAAFQAALISTCTELAKAIARDGEGAEKLIEVQVSGARNIAEARLAAKTVASSPLLKAAVHGADPNWGRIAAALGRSGAELDSERLTVRVQGHCLFTQGMPQAFTASQVSQAMKTDTVVIEADLGVGSASGSAWGCDLTEGYVRINADYTT